MFRLIKKKVGETRKAVTLDWAHVYEQIIGVVQI